MRETMTRQAELTLQLRVTETVERWPAADRKVRLVGEVDEDFRCWDSERGCDFTLVALDGEGGTHLYPVEVPGEELDLRAGDVVAVTGTLCSPPLQKFRVRAEHVLRLTPRVELPALDIGS